MGLCPAGGLRGFLKLLDLRFPSRGEESRYIAHVEPELVQLEIIAAALTLVCTLPFQVHGYIEECFRKDDPFRWDADDPRVLYYAAHGLYLASITMFLIPSTLRLRRGWFRTWAWESIGVAFAIFTLCVFVCGSGWHVAMLWGQEPARVWAPGTYAVDADLKLLVKFDTIITAFCLFIPIRTCKTWILPIFIMVVLIGLAQTVGSPYPEMVTGNTVIAFCLCAFSHFGAYCNEKHSREKWRAVRREQVQDEEIHLHAETSQKSSMWAARVQGMAKHLCNMTITLADDLSIVDPGDSCAQDDLFGSMIKGLSFVDILASYDRSRFTEHIALAAAPPHLQCLLATIQTRAGPLEANLLIVAGAGERPYYFIGICVKSESVFAMLDRELMVQGVRLLSMGPEGKEVATEQTAEEAAGTQGHHRDDQRLQQQLSHIVELGRQEHWLIDTAELKVQPLSILGKGGFGVVMAATLHGTDVAVKAPIVANDNALFHRPLPSISNELYILRRVRHPNIIMFFGACIDPDRIEIALVFERLFGKPLNEFISAPPAPPGTRSRYTILLDVCSALQYLHANVPQVVHGDLKHSNVFVEFTGSPTPRGKLLDFGLSRLITRHSKLMGSTVGWRAPEIAKKASIVPSPAADVYAFGLLVRFVVLGLQPVEEDPPKATTPPAEAELAGESDRLCLMCLEPDPASRPTMALVYATVLGWRLPGDTGEREPTQGACGDMGGARGGASINPPAGREGVMWQDALEEVREFIAQEDEARGVLWEEEIHFGTLRTGLGGRFWQLGVSGPDDMPQASDTSCIPEVGDDDDDPVASAASLSSASLP